MKSARERAVEIVESAEMSMSRRSGLVFSITQALKDYARDQRVVCLERLASAAGVDYSRDLASAVRNAPYPGES